MNDNEDIVVARSDIQTRLKSHLGGLDGGPFCFSFESIAPEAADLGENGAKAGNDQCLLESTKIRSTSASSVVFHWWLKPELVPFSSISVQKVEIYAGAKHGSWNVEKVEMCRGLLEYNLLATAWKCTIRKRASIRNSEIPAMGTLTH